MTHYSSVIYDYKQNAEGSPIAEIANGAEVGYGDNGYNIYNAYKEDVIVRGIRTKFGYHLFAATSVSTRSNLETDTEKPVRYIPTLEEIQKNASGQTVSSSVKTAISTYYSNYQKELSGADFFTVLQNNEIKALVSDANLKTYIDNYNNDIFENTLKYVTKDFLN